MSWLTESKEYTERMNRVYNKLTESCEKKLEERNWKHTVPWQLSAEFHKLLHADCADYDAIRDVLKKITEFIKSKVGEDDWYYDDLLDDLEYAEFETDDDANYYINEVYDLLDSYSIWMDPFIGSKMKESEPGLENLTKAGNALSAAEDNLMDVRDRQLDAYFDTKNIKARNYIQVAGNALADAEDDLMVVRDAEVDAMEAIKYNEAKMKEGRFPKKEYFYLSTPDTVICDEDGNTLKFDTHKEAEDYIDEYHKGEDVKVLRRRPQFEESKIKESLATMTGDGYLKFRALQSKVDSNILLEEIMNELKTDEAESVVNELCIRYNIDMDEWKRLNFYESKKMKEYYVFNRSDNAFLVSHQLGKDNWEQEEFETSEEAYDYFNSISSDDYVELIDPKDRLLDYKGQLIHESKMKESEDGWNESVLENCGDVLDNIYDLTYEIKNCIKGAYTGCHTYEELADYIRGLADDLKDAADGVAYCCDDEDDEDFDESCNKMKEDIEPVESEVEEALEAEEKPVEEQPKEDSAPKKLKKGVAQDGLIERCPAYDFEDDGNHFRGYLYKNALPISALGSDGDVYYSIRIDYIDDSRHSTEDWDIADKYNGVPKADFDAADFIDCCEKMYKKYVEPRKEIAAAYVIEDLERYYLNKYRKDMYLKSMGPAGFTTKNYRGWIKDHYSDRYKLGDFRHSEEYKEFCDEIERLGLMSNPTYEKVIDAVNLLKHEQKVVRNMQMIDPKLPGLEDFEGFTEAKLKEETTVSDVVQDADAALTHVSNAETEVMRANMYAKEVVDDLVDLVNQGNLTEAKLEEYTPHKAMQSFGTAMSKKVDVLNRCKTVNDIKNFVVSVCEPLSHADAEQEAKYKEMITILDSIRNATRAMEYIYNFILAGDGLKTIK